MMHKSASTTKYQACTSRSFVGWEQHRMMSSAPGVKIEMHPIIAACSAIILKLKDRKSCVVGGKVASFEVARKTERAKMAI